MTAPNKNEGLIARLLERTHLVPEYRPDTSGGQFTTGGDFKLVSQPDPDCQEAARAIQDLEAALKPFSGIAASIAECWTDETIAVSWQEHSITVGQFRRAAKALASTADGEG